MGRSVGGTVVAGRVVSVSVSVAPDDTSFVTRQLLPLIIRSLAIHSSLVKIDAIIAPYKFDDAARRNYSAMVYYMDEVVGSIVDTVKAKGIWNNTVIALMSDNGGPLYLPGSGNNHPLKGGKYSDWEGGVRTNALISGGYIPRSSRGQKYSGLVSIADWYGMFSNLAGVSLKDEKADEANAWMRNHRPELPELPEVDALDGLFDNIVSLNNTNLHPTLPLSDQAIIQYPFKLITGVHPYSNWTGAIYPNCSTVENRDLLPWHNDSNLFEFHINWSEDPQELWRHLWGDDCGASGCLFNIEEDPSETHDLSTDPKFSDKLQELQVRKRMNFFFFHE